MSSLTVTLIQSKLHWENKAANLQHFGQQISAIEKGTEIVILPEMFTTGFSMNTDELAEEMNGVSVDWMKKISREKRIILTGSLIIKEEGKYFNRLIWMLPNGQSGFYNKRHLFAFAGEDQKYTPGSSRLIASVKGWKINLQVCYDLRFPVWSRQSVHALPDEQLSPPLQRTPQAPEFDMIIYVANWPERRSHAWKTLLMARAIENQSYVIGVNRVGSDGNGIYYSGDSMIVDPLGEVLYSKTHDEDVFTIALQKEKLEEVRAKFPFWKDADKFSIHTSE